MAETDRGLCGVHKLPDPDAPEFAPIRADLSVQRRR
jgi:hypothetical protein